MPRRGGTDHAIALSIAAAIIMFPRRMGRRGCLYAAFIVSGDDVGIVRAIAAWRRCSYVPRLLACPIFFIWLSLIRHLTSC
jgi:hypothetical protein